MNFLKKHTWEIAGCIIAIIILVIAFMAGGNRTATQVPEKTIVTPAPAVTAVNETAVPTDSPAEETQTPTATPDTTIKPTPTAKKAEKTNEASQIKETATPTEKPKEEDTLTCTLSVRCDTILANMSELKPEKAGLVPSDGVIFPKTEVEFNKGESVYNVLVREMKKNRIHMEFVNVPMYNSTYIEGIANLYEHDCGELSGWMYKVNGSFPNYGSSKYTVKDGDAIEWVYTCDWGNDIGGGYSPRNGRKDD